MLTKGCPVGRFKRAIIALFAILSILSVSSCSSDSDTAANGSKIRFALDWTPNTNHTGLYVALDQGYFKAAGLDVELLPFNQTLPDQLINAGQADFGISFQSNFSVAKAAGANIVSVLAVLQHWSTAIVVKADAGIASPADLTGKTYAGFGEPAEISMLQQIIAKAGGKPDFESVMLGTSAYEALYNGQADFTVAFLAWEGIEAKLRGYDLKHFNYSDFDFPDAYNVIVSGNPDWIKDHPDEAKDFVQALQRGYEYAAQHPKEAAQILINQNPGFFTDEELVFESQELLSSEYLLDAEGNFGTQTLQQWQEYGDFLFENGLLVDDAGKTITEPIDWSTYFTTDLVSKP